MLWKPIPDSVALAQFQRDAIAKSLAAIAASRRDYADRYAGVAEPPVPDFRGILDIACRGGKPRSAWGVSYAMDGTGTVMFLHNMHMVTQTMREWYLVSPTPFRALCVYSASEQKTATASGMAGVGATTDPAVIEAFWTNTHDPRPPVIFCTFQSAEKLMDALQQRPATLGIIDEADLLTGHVGKAQHIMLSQIDLPMHVRLSLTATVRQFVRVGRGVWSSSASTTQS